jgi:hypothetical protein
VEMLDGAYAIGKRQVLVVRNDDRWFAVLQYSFEHFHGICRIEWKIYIYIYIYIGATYCLLLG